MKNLTIKRDTKPAVAALALLCTKDQLPKIPNKGFTGDYLETALLYKGDIPTLYIGVGKVEDLTQLSYKELGATITKAFDSAKTYTFGVDPSALPMDPTAFSNLAQGLALGQYRFSLTSEKKKPVKWNITIHSSSNEEKPEKDAIALGVTLAEGAIFARDMTNLPANHLRPAQFAKEIEALLTPLGVEYQVISGKDLAKKGLNGLFLIGDSSEFPPQLVVLRYKNGAGKKTALVGKGITYDTGGSDLKTNMTNMQGDMAGAAAVVGAIYALAATKAKANVVGVLALAENRLSPGSLVAGDVYTAYDGQTVEVLNTDAEGRLVLADAVSYAVKDEKADQVLDIATLTGAVVRALGFGVSGVVANSCDLWKQLKSSGQQTGERFLRFPDYPEYQKMLESNVADMKNIGGPEAGSITGGLFIGRFVQEKPWVHVDIAGTSWVKTPLFAHQSKGGTGTGVDTLYYFCKN